MTATELLTISAQAGKRTHLIGDINAGVIIALDMEGRLFTVKEGSVLNRVNPDAIAGQSTALQYLNPGGDGLWPAPEGTSLGYQYSTGKWRVPPGLRSVRYLVTEINSKGTTIEGEVDLINNKGQGIPTIFKRQVKIATSKKIINVHVRESITYVGSIKLNNKECLLAPWSLCQFDSGPGCEVVFPYSTKSSLWDLYDESSSEQRRWTKTLFRTVADSKMRYQIALDKKVPWIKFCDYQRGLFVRRSAGELPKGQSYIDISDAPPHIPPSNKGVRYSVYNDPNNFMEIESVSGCPTSILPGTEMSIHTATSFQLK